MEYTVTVNWGALHEAVKEMDCERRKFGIGVTHGVLDVFGGSYRPNRYQEMGVEGLCEILAAANKIAKQAWERVHGGAAEIECAARCGESDYKKIYCSSAVGRGLVHHKTIRGAKCRATRYGGEWWVEKVLDERNYNKRQKRTRERIKSAIKTAIFVDRVFKVLAECGVKTYNPKTHICGVHDGRINLTGIRWMMGEKTESDTPPTLFQAEACLTPNYFLEESA